MEPGHSSPHTAHHEVWLLLPWYVNGTLEGPELNLVQQHLQICITCRKEIAVQQRLAEAIRNSSVIALSPQVAFSRLRERIVCGAQSPKDQTRWWRRHQSWLDVWPRLPNGSLPRPAAIALSLLLMIGLALAARPWLMSLFETPKYHTLAHPNSLPASGQHNIRVIFAKTADQQEIELLLRTIRGEVVDGPSSIDVYTVKIVSNNGSSPDILAVLERLRHHPSVLLAEPGFPIPGANRDEGRDP
ncbi:MAG: anti-sigma factor family protein [Gammaproteobacteria bacterium]